MFKRYTIRFGQARLGSVLLACAIGGCSSHSTPPGANSISGGAEDTVYSYHYWEEGLAILLWHDFSYGSSGCNGSASTEDPVYRLTCGVESGDGRTFDWKVHSIDGVTARMWINDQSYDLDQGNMFLIGSQGGQLQVIQLQRDLTGLEPDYESIAALASSDSAVAEFIANIAVQQPE